MNYYNKFRKKNFNRFFYKAKLSYAQCGEDLILSSIFQNINNGFFIDIGANNPYIQSNTCLFYKKGWTGIKINALPDSMKIFNKYRKRDINLEIAISDNDEKLKYFMFSSSFYNSFVEDEIEEK